MPRVGARDLLAGLVVMALGGFVVWHGLGYRLGTVSRMGPGFFPVMLGWLTVALGALLVASALVGPALGRWFGAWGGGASGFGASGLGASGDEAGEEPGRRGLPRVAWRAMLAVLAAIGCFALLLRLVGLLPAIAVTVAVASLGDRAVRLHEVALVGLGAVVGAWAIFHVGLGLTVPILRWPF